MAIRTAAKAAKRVVRRRKKKAVPKIARVKGRRIIKRPDGGMWAITDPSKLAGAKKARKTASKKPAKVGPTGHKLSDWFAGTRKVGKKYGYQVKFKGKVVYRQEGAFYKTQAEAQQASVEAVIGMIGW